MKPDVTSLGAKVIYIAVSNLLITIAIVVPVADLNQFPKNAYNQRAQIAPFMRTACKSIILATL